MNLMLQNGLSCPKFNINQQRDNISERFCTFFGVKVVNVLVFILNISLSMVIYPKISLCSIPSLITGSVFDLPPNFPLPPTPHISLLISHSEGSLEIHKCIIWDKSRSTNDILKHNASKKVMGSLIC